MIPKPSRRTFLRAMLLAGCAPAIGQGFIPIAISATTHAGMASNEIWRRFIDRRADTLLHYAGLEGECILPTPEDCAECRPNGMSWSTPIEDGPFFGGLYLAGLCRHLQVWDQEGPNSETAKKARLIAAGLLRLSLTGFTPGFVARGLAADGAAHYPASSEDQVFPWFYGLWSYARSVIPSASQKAEIISRLLETIRAVESHEWRIPCDPVSFGYRGTYVRFTSHDCARLLFLLRALHDLTGDESWLEKYRQRLSERGGKMNLTRLELCAGGLEFGPADNPHSYLWTGSMCQAALRGLADLETDPVVKAEIQRGLDASARSALPHLARYRRFDNKNDLRFDPDWRFLNASWKPQANCDEAIALARTQLPLWAEHNPRSPYEDDTLREPLFAAWIVRLAGGEIKRQADNDIHEMLLRTEWRRLYTASMFIAVNVAAEYYLQGEKR